eukprot:18882-Rhodomonas_salina.1
MSVGQGYSQSVLHNGMSVVQVYSQSQSVLHNGMSVAQVYSQSVLNNGSRVSGLGVLRSRTCGEILSSLLVCADASVLTDELGADVIGLLMCYAMCGTET